MTSEIIFKDITTPDKVLLKKEQLMEHLAGIGIGEKEVFMTVGAGDIDRFVGPVTEMLKERTQ